MISFQKTSWAAALSLAFAAGAFARAESDWDVPDDSRFPYSSNSRPLLLDEKRSISGESFFAAATKKLDDDFKRVNLWGANVRYSYETAQSVVVGALVVPEFYGIAGFGYGSQSKSYSETATTYPGTTKADALLVQLAGGANLRCHVNEQFSVFGGVRAGFAYESVKVEQKSPYFSSISEREDDIGFLYGVGAGAELKLSEQGSLTFGIDYLASTAQPDFSGDIEGKVDKQAYVVFSIGAKFTF